jgi:uncharacterized membrane protein
MANWKIQDIAPPKSKRQKEESDAQQPSALEEQKKKAKKKRRIFPGWIRGGFLLFIVGFVIVAVGIIHIFFAQAEVTVWPEVRTIKLLKPIRIQVGTQETNKEQRIIRALISTEHIQGTRLSDASGKSIRENRASGTIRVFNAYTTSPQTLIAKTRFVSEDRKLFRTPERVTVPGATEQGGKLVPGFLDVEVIAAEPGEDYNIGPSNFSLPGLSGSPSYTAIYAVSTQPMIGGSEREIFVVSKEDIERAKEALIEELTQKVTENLLGRVPEGMAASKGSVVVDVIEADSLVEPGAEIDRFNVSVSLGVTAYLFPQADLDMFADMFLTEELQDGERIVKEKTLVSFEKIAMEGENTAVLELGITALAYQYVDPTELKIKLRGKSKNEAGGILSSYGIFHKADISLWPFWVSSIPGNVDKVQVRLVVD